MRTRMHAIACRWAHSINYVRGEAGPASRREFCTGCTKARQARDFMTELDFLVSNLCPCLVVRVGRSESRHCWRDCRFAPFGPSA